MLAHVINQVSNPAIEPSHQSLNVFAICLWLIDEEESIETAKGTCLEPHEDVHKDVLLDEGVPLCDQPAAQQRVLHYPDHGLVCLRRHTVRAPKKGHAAKQS